MFYDFKTIHDGMGIFEMAQQINIYGNGNLKKPCIVDGFLLLHE